MRNSTVGKVYIVVGGQYGSESKGQFAAFLSEKEHIEYAVRTGSINAGHTVYYKGVAHKNQQIPVSWVLPEVQLIIGAGAYVSPTVLAKEIEDIEKATSNSLVYRLFIDHRAGSQLESHKLAEKGMHERMGSTGEGVSEAIMDKMRRGYDYQLFKDTDYAKENNGIHFQIVDTVQMLNDAYDDGQKILLEGTQGTLLDLHLSYYPYCTSRQTIAASWLAEAGLSPKMNIEITMVCRTYPIRVAGNSGPMPLEIDWADLAHDINIKRVLSRMEPLIKESSLNVFRKMVAQVAKEMGLPSSNLLSLNPTERKKYSAQLAEIHREVFLRLPEEVNKDLFQLFETTTVTKKLRRISEIDLDELKYTVMINRPDYIVMNFLNYKFPTLKAGTDIKRSKEWKEIEQYLNEIEIKTGVHVEYVNFSPFDIVQI